MVDPLDNLTSSEQLRRLLLQEEQERIDRLEARLGDDDALTESLVPVIADVLRDAGVSDYRRLADALAPIVLQSIKTEIHNSRDMMVDALYPITGRLVAAAVRNAFKDLVDQLNTKLDSTLSVDRWRAKIKAGLSGRSEAEVLLSEGAAFDIVDLLLINRQSGLLIAQVGPDADEGGVDSHLMSSILTAIMAFVRDAMSQSDEQDLRTLHVGDVRLHLQVSPGAILAVKTKGPPPSGFDSSLGETFYAFLSRWGKTLSDPERIEGRDAIALGEDLEQRFQALLEAKRANFRGSSRKGTILLGALASIALLWIGWSVYEGWHAGRIEAQAMRVIDQREDLAGYPIEAQYEADGRLAIRGLLPSREAIEALHGDLRAALPNVDLALDVGSLPERQVDLTGLATIEDLSDWRRSTNDETLQLFESRMAPFSEAITSIEGRLAPPADMELAAFRSWLDRQSIKFRDDSTVDDEDGADDVLEAIADRLASTPEDIGLRVVGYGDDLGNEQVSDRVSRARAVLVANRLRALGVLAERLQVVGRGKERRVSDIDGPESLNRRVEFELAYFPDSEVSNGVTRGNDDDNR